MFGNNAIHANFSVDNLMTAKDFYTNTLGFKILAEYGTNLMLEAGNGTKINIYEKKDHKAWDSTILGIEVDDVRQALAQLKEKGVEIANIPGTDEDGVLQDSSGADAAWFQDPAGNWLCVNNLGTVLNK